jgi:hypothetical protein
VTAELPFGRRYESPLKLSDTAEPQSPDCSSYVRWYDPAAALVYAASGVMKVSMFDRITKDVRSGGLADPRHCGIDIHGQSHHSRYLPLAPCAHVVAASILAIESPVFIWVHVQDREIPANNSRQ